jgi:hypothetical protein
MDTKKLLLPEHVFELVQIIERAVPPLGVSYAIGGAVAMNVHGYRRHTDDVDLFVGEQDRPTVLRALRAAGLVTAAMMAPYIYIAKLPNETDPNIRIDVLVPEDDPELSAIEMPAFAKILDTELRIFTAEMLALSKFYSERPEDHRDLQKMWELGLLDVTELRRLLSLMDSGAVEVFDAETRSFSEKRGRQRPKRKRP